MDYGKTLKIAIIIFSVFVVVLGIVNAIAFASATDDTCNSINKAWAETMMVLNIVMIFMGVIVVAFVTYELFKGAGKEDLMNKSKTQSNKKITSRKSDDMMVDNKPIPKMNNQYQDPDEPSIRTAASIYDRGLTIDRELLVAQQI